MVRACRGRYAFLLAVLTAAGLGGVLWAGGGKPGTGAPAAPKGGNQHLYDELRKVINQGADIYNGSQFRPGDPNGCYRYFQGALSVLRLQLDGHPDLVRAIDTGLSEAERLPSAEGRAFALRKVMDDVRSKINPGGKKPETREPAATKPGTKEPGTKEPGTTKPEAKEPAKPATLWDRLGGPNNVAKVVDDFVSRASKDDRVDFTRKGKYPLNDEKVKQLKKELIDFVSQATAGPRGYTGENMKKAHEGMEITDKQFDAAVEDLKEALDKYVTDKAAMNELLKTVKSTRSAIVQAKKPESTKEEPKKTEPKKTETKPEKKESTDKKPDTKSPPDK
jgi:truncated hemoglobin YjbI